MDRPHDVPVLSKQHDDNGASYNNYTQQYIDRYINPHDNQRQPTSGYTGGQTDPKN